MNFDQWWFHGHLDYPPHADDFMEFPAGGTATMQVSCDKGYTDYYASAPGGDNRDLNSNLACPGQPTTAIHANNIEDVTGCAIAIAYKSDVNDVQPEDFAIFTTNHTCPWYLNTNFDIPAGMPACPEGGCICAWFWIHAADSGAEQMYMNGFQCKITGDTGNTAIGTPGLARRCGADPANGVPDATPSNCTVGPVQPFYWDQNERNNMFEGIYSPPLYNDLYGLTNGAQPNLFQEPTIGGTGAPAPPAAGVTSSDTAAATSSQAASSPTTQADSAPSSSADVQTSAASPTPEPTTSTTPAPVESTTPTPAPEPTTTDVTTSVATLAADTTTAVVATTSSADPTPSTSAPKCKRRLPGEMKKRRAKKSKRSAAERHMKKRLAHESH
ncbi:hypothetical protein EIP86_007179 [Pleurotus ostreatoroseus]|nr:hypothetical protein EIP86_007179 [Pleurotus ostreatoroseus]